ncbi:MFS transporter [Glutamicibacter sp. MNS18]|uniref:MFS transporter n=1 Tax=Glutamicibacter sp. MNS18 TaxID=2989817 RepID=UPI00278C4C7B|nr:MFS transporter [Glutamicibacter sp. MNS18]
MASGLLLSTLVSRLPALRDELQLDHASVGLLLLCLSAGSFLSVSLSGQLVSRLGATLVMRLCAATAGSSLALVGLSSVIWHQPWLTGIFLFTQGLGVASWNVASNVQGAALERTMGRTLMPLLHGFFSLGTVIGAGIGAGAAALGVGIGVHYLLMGIVVAGSVVLGARHFGEDGSRTSREGSNKSLGRAWRESRTILLGVLVLGMALAEGAAADWVALALADGYGTTEATGALGYAVFVTAMTAMRMLGGELIFRLGRVVMIRISAVTALVGLLVFTLGQSLPLAFVALGLWGAGVALTFPLAMSAASDDPLHAAARVSVVSTIGYGAFLGGPPLLGLLANQIGLLPALSSISVLIVLALILSSNASGYPKDPAGSDHDSPGK